MRGSIVEGRRGRGVSQSFIQWTRELVAYCNASKNKLAGHLALVSTITLSECPILRQKTCWSRAKYISASRSSNTPSTGQIKKMIFYFIICIWIVPPVSASQSLSLHNYLSICLLLLLLLLSKKKWTVLCDFETKKWIFFLINPVVMKARLRNSIFLSRQRFMWPTTNILQLKEREE